MYRLTKNHMAITQFLKRRGAPERYLTYGPLEGEYGFLHQWNNIHAVIKESWSYKRTAVLPKNVYLSKFHNFSGGMWSSWDRYWDISELDIYTYQSIRFLFSKQIKFKKKSTLSILWLNDIKKWLSERPHKMIIRESLKEITGEIAQVNVLYRQPSHIVWAHNIPAVKNGFFNNLGRRIKLFPNRVRGITLIHAKPASEVGAVVSDIVGQLGQDFWAIHIRRNDVLEHPNHMHSIYASAMPWVIANLKCARLAHTIPIFLMTDEKKSSYLLPLQKKFKIVRVTDFESFQNLFAKYPSDNFLRFHIEKLIFDQAKRRYKTATYWGEKLEAISYPKPAVRKLNFLPPHYPISTGSEEKYFSYLSLEKKNKWLDKWPSLLLARYHFAQKMLGLRLSLRRQP